MRQNTESRYIIGIDLGTTNTTISYVDTQEENPISKTLPIPQIIAPGEVAERDTLPSYVYLADPANLNEGSLDLPWDEDHKDYCVGAYASKMSSSLPTMIVASAKSWLCNESVEKMDDILPFATEANRKISPVEASTYYLDHIAEAWNYAMAEDDLNLEIFNQQVVLTVPASFDAVARELTVQAAELAGLNVTLLEEPQAAFYSWLHENEVNWRDQLQAGDSVLVCDIGGGTSDFSLIAVEDNEGELTLRRQAVGNHILLGGDNMDMTLAYVVQQKLGKQLNAKQMAALIHSCRQAKEKLCADPEATSETITILGSGSSLIGGTLQSELTRDEVYQFILNGFTPDVSFDDSVQRQTRSGLRSFGLNYETDTALTRHLAEFLRNNTTQADGSVKMPVAVLFNGGVSKADLLRDKILANLNTWSEQELVSLSGTDPDLAVARGAAWFGFSKRGNAIRIKSGTAFSYYLGIESSMPAVPGFPPPIDAVCAIPFGSEDGTTLELPLDHLGLLVGEKTEFKFFSSQDRQEDEVGSVINSFGISELTELPALTAELKDEENEGTNIVPIKLSAHVTDIGTIQIWCHALNSDKEWRLEFELSEED